MALNDETISAVVQNIMHYLSNTGLSESFFVTVLKRLDSFGYSIDPANNDDWLISFVSQKVERYIINKCNIKSVPDGLINHAVDRVCGEFFFSKMQTGQLDMGGLDFSNLSSLSEGDTSISFDNNSSDESKANLLINQLINSGEGELSCYRKIRW